MLKNLVIAAASLAGCAASREPVITYQMAPQQAVSEVEFVVGEEGDSLRQQFASHLSRALAEDGVAVAPGSRWVADFAVASQPADTTIVPVSQDAADEPPKANRPQWLDACRETKVKGTLAIFERATNRLVAKAEGDYRGCPGDRSSLAGLAGLLVRSVK